MELYRDWREPLSTAGRDNRVRERHGNAADFSG
jgi:hypothetical protein